MPTRSISTAISNVGHRILECRAAVCFLFALALSCISLPITSTAQTFTILANFDGSNGSQPVAALVQGLDGSFYGPTTAGGAYSGGTVFKVTQQGTLTAIYSFCAQSGCPDGRQADSQMIQALDGNFYGTTTFGGINDNYGTVYKITAEGKLKTLYEFCSQSNCSDGAYLYGGIIQATNGNFYGTTNEGGDLTCFAPYGCGTVFKLTPTGVLTTLYSFHTGDGQSPFAGLVQARDGNFYGTTGYGGAYGYGTVFKITPSGAYTTLYSFCAQTFCTDGSLSYGPLIQGTDGNLYGMTENGGTVQFGGTIYKITPAGILTTLHNFSISDGSGPDDALVEAVDGNFYGTTVAGGDYNVGTAFKISPSGVFSTLISFGVPTTGGTYPSGLIQSTDGNFYGIAEAGGANNDGLVFRLSVGLGPFVQTRPTSGKVGAKIFILGNNLTGTTSVSFNGTAATYTVISDTEIKATVPAGATTGKVQAKTPSGTLKSNFAFRVRP